MIDLAPDRRLRFVGCFPLIIRAAGLDEGG